MSQDYKFVLCIAESLWWTEFARSPANLRRVVYRGADRPLTKEELIDDALSRAREYLNLAYHIQDPLNNSCPVQPISA